MAAMYSLADEPMPERVGFAPVFAIPVPDAQPRKLDPAANS